MADKMRFTEDDVCMEDDIDVEGKNNEILFGYLCAYDAFVAMTDYESKLQAWLNDDNNAGSIDDCYINFYPCYNAITKEFYVEASYYIGDKHYGEKLELTDEESDYLKKTFFETYYDCSLEEVDDVLAKEYGNNDQGFSLDSFSEKL